MSTELLVLVFTVFYLCIPRCIFSAFEFRFCWVDETTLPISWIEAIWGDAEITEDYRSADLEATILFR